MRGRMARYSYGDPCEDTYLPWLRGGGVENDRLVAVDGRQAIRVSGLSPQS